MDVSSFELIFKNQAPAGDVEQVLQGYFLSITNLENKNLKFRVEFVIFPPPPGTPNQELRSLAGNTLTFVDAGGTDNQRGILSGTLASSIFQLSTGFINVPANGTALLAVLPSANLFGPLDPTPITDPKFEVRGFVRIALPALLSGFPLRFVPQSNGPVSVLLTPQHRATFFSSTGAITNQVQATLPLATGAARTLVPPEPGGPFILQPLPALDAVAELGATLEAMPLELRPAMLTTLLAQVDADQSDLRGFNEALARAQVPLAIERSKRKSG